MFGLYKESKLRDIARAGDGSKLAKLITAGAKVNEKDVDGWTALMYAAESGHEAVVNALLEAGASVDEKNKCGWNAFMLAVAQGHTEILKRLLAAGAKIDVNDGTGMTALMLAAQSSKTNSVKFLIYAGVDVNKTDDEGNTSLMRAAENCNIDILNALIKAGAKVNEKNKDGSTAVIKAIEYAQIEVLKALLAAGALVDGKNKMGKSALDLAKETGNKEMIALVEFASKSAKPDTLPCPPSSVSIMPYMTAGDPGAIVLSSSDIKEKMKAKVTIIPYEELKLSKVILGEGGFGIVYKGVWQYTDVAVKQLKTAHLTEESLVEFKREAERHAALRHPNVVTLYGVCLDPGKYCMVMELMVGGSLYQVLHNGKELPWSVRLSIAKDIAIGLSFLHEQKIVHRDLKSLNVLLDDRMRAKLTDFGLSKVKSESSVMTAAAKVVGTLNWMAPELFKLGAKCTEASDIYALGMVFWELASREVPYGSAGGKDSLVKDWIKEGVREEIPGETPYKMANLLSRCWAQKIEDRPKSAKEVVDELMKESSISHGAGKSSLDSEYPLFSN